MKILAHRGYWKDKNDRNKLESLELALFHGYGIETDIRDYNGKIVVSHDIADDSCFEFEKLVKIISSGYGNLPIAVNIKSDGLQKLYGDLCTKYGFCNGFVFDMSIPEQVVYKNMGIPFFTRKSDIEADTVHYDYAVGIWMDTWEKEWITKEEILRCLNDGKKVCIISPEIHDREYLKLWNMLYELREHDDVMLCTDIPDIARKFFYEK